MDVNARLDRMDRDGIDFQLLSPNPLTYFHHIPREAAVAFCRRHNDALAAVVAEHPSRLGGLAALPMQCPTSAAAELTRAVDELGLLVRRSSSMRGASVVCTEMLPATRPHTCTPITLAG